MQVRLWASAALPLLAVAVACGSSRSTGSFDDAPGATDASAVDSSRGVVSSSTACPATPMAGGSVCGVPLRCEYGTSASLQCNTLVDCDPQMPLTVTPPSTTECDDRCPTFDAPGALATAQGMPCLHGSRGNLVCGSPYDRSTCGCTNPGDAGITSDGGTEKDAGADADADADASDVAGVWICVTPAVGCPATRPALGAGCVNPITCDYGACVFPGGMRVACTDVDGEPGVSLWVDGNPAACKTDR